MRKAVLVLFMVCMTAVHSLDNGLALTPPMGWLSWERYRCNIDCKDQPTEYISENLYKAQAERMVSDGYRDVGYVYVNIDDCWPLKSRNANGSLVPDPDRFPSGMKALADFMHARGLKLGIYSDMGTETCGGYPGSKFYMEQDANLFAAWGIDSLKLDGCYSTTADFPDGYPVMGQYLNLTGRPILYSCSWPAYITGSGKTPPYQSIAKSCNLWRNYADIADSWESVTGIIDWFGQDKGNLSLVARPGAWNDPDMLILGNYGLSYSQQRVQMALWAIMAAPLYMSNDLRSIANQSRDLLLNKAVIAVNQDPLGMQGQRLQKINNLEFWMRPLTPYKSRFAFALVNFANGGGPQRVSLTLANFAIPEGKYMVTEVFDGTIVGTMATTESFIVNVSPSGVFFAVASKTG